MKRIHISILWLTMLSGPTFAQYADSVWLDYQEGLVTSGDVIMTDIQVEATALYTYYAGLVWNNGYMGLQRGGSGFYKHVHFSVWDPSGGGFAVLVWADPGVVTERFGGEGTGWKAMWPFNWAQDTTYRLGLSVWRGWCSVDVAVRGEDFRYICTHLEEETAPQLQMAQALELLAGPAHGRRPVILAGDLNADPLHRNGTQTYDVFVAAGFKDAWAATHHAHPAGGLTWGHDEFLADPGTAFTWRLDLLLDRGGDLEASSASVLDLGLGRTQSPLWASDHAAVSASFEIEKSRCAKHENESEDKD